MARFIPNENSFIGFTPGPIGLLAAPSTVTATGAGAGSLVTGTYNYKVTSVNDEGESAASTVASVTTTSDGGVDLTWDLVSGATSYNIYGRKSSGGGVTLLTTLGGGATTFHDDGSRTPTNVTAPSESTASNIAAPTVGDINAAVDLTSYTTSLNASSQGNNVPTPNFSTLFETSILGTSQATFTADFYRDDKVDLAWQTLARKSEGFFLISRFGGIPNEVGDSLEVWPVRVTSRAMAAMSNNTVETFTVTCAVPNEPNEDAVVVA